MKKQNIIAVSVVVVILAAVGVVFVTQNKVKVASDKNQTQQQVIDNNQNQENLSWYEVPEIGVKFKVTSNEKDDLKYVVYNTNDGVTKDQFTVASFYNQTEFDVNDSCKIKDGKPTCYSFNLSRRNEDLLNNSAIKLGNSIPLCVKKILKVGDDAICYSPSTTSDFSNNVDYEKYIELVSSKNLHFNIDSAESL